MYYKEYSCVFEYIYIYIYIYTINVLLLFDNTTEMTHLKMSAHISSITRNACSGSSKFVLAGSNITILFLRWDIYFVLLNSNIGI